MVRLKFLSQPEHLFREGLLYWEWPPEDGVVFDIGVSPGVAGML